MFEALNGFNTKSHLFSTNHSYMCYKSLIYTLQTNGL